jgi:hypothetical protein
MCLTAIFAKKQRPLPSSQSLAWLAKKPSDTAAIAWLDKTCYVESQPAIQGHTEQPAVDA